VSKGVTLVLEGANMPTTPEAIHHFRKTKVILAAAKACNAGARVKTVILLPARVARLPVARRRRGACDAAAVAVVVVAGTGCLRVRTRVSRTGQTCAC
jgi:hypothetical protein